MRRSPQRLGAILGIGTLRELEVKLPNGSTKRILFGREWLAWDQRRKMFHICTPERRYHEALPANVQTAHRRFHRAKTSAALLADVPQPSGQLRYVGLVRALVYQVPQYVRSPGKNKYQWHHAFGDTGHAGGDSYPDRLMPALMVDQRDHFFIRRRPGNIFTVDTWLRG